MLAKLILEVILIRLFDIIREIAEKSKGRHHGGQLGYEFYLDRMTPDYGRMISLHGFQHYIIQLRSGYLFPAVLIHFQRYFNGFEYPGLFLGRNKQNGNISERRQTFLSTSSHNLWPYWFPFPPGPIYSPVPLSPFLSLTARLNILRSCAAIPFSASISNRHTSASSSALDGADHGIKFQVLMHFCFAADTGSIDQDKFFLK